jgi:endogenous inhibitor of DNA gyrase (YacG/DUF329 family)
MKNCKRCSKALENKRHSFCSDRCKYLFNSKKRDDERYVAPPRKRNSHFFYQFQCTKVSKGQGRRCGSTIQGSMSVGREPIYIAKPVCLCTLWQHFKNSHNLRYAQLCDGNSIYREEFFSGRIK